MRNTGILFVMSVTLLIAGCGKEEVSQPVEEPIAAEESVVTEQEQTVEEIEEVVHPEDELYIQFIEGTIADSNGNNSCYAKNDPYYEDYIDLEWAITDLNGDGVNELIPRLYGGYTSELYSYADGEIITVSNEVFGSEGGFINTNNQLIATDCTHANRNQFMVSEFTGAEKVDTILFFAKWWEDDSNPDDAEYVKYEGSDWWEVSYDDYTVITKEEYEELIQQYTQKNEEIVFSSR